MIFAEDLAGQQPTMTATSSLTGPGAGSVVVPVPPPPSHELSVATLGGVAPGTARFTEGAGSCPDSSKIGTARIDAPAVVGHPLEGVVYLATPHENPFDSLLAFYISVDDPQSGVVTKLPGLIEADPQTGRLTMTISEMPQLPFEDVKFEFFKGATAPLKTGIACGTFRVNSDLTPWTAPASVVVHSDDTFTIEKGAGAGACVKDEPSAPNTPTFEAGTFEPTGGVYSPVTFKLTRLDGTQQLSAIDATLPKGLIAKTRGNSLLLRRRARLGGRQDRPAGAGRPELPGRLPCRRDQRRRRRRADPVLPPGRTSSSPVPTKAHPLSLAAIVPAVAGPFDLGDVVVRIALHLDSEAAQIRAVSDPLPSILEGIPLSIRSVVLSLDRSQFTLNPTNCGSTSITGSLTALTGQAVGLNEHFQVGECGKLGFKPKLALSLKGSTKRRANPSLRAELTPRDGDANLGQAIITLPKTALLDNAPHPGGLHEGRVRRLELSRQLRLWLCQSGHAAARFPDPGPRLPAQLRHLAARPRRRPPRPDQLRDRCPHRRDKGRRHPRQLRKRPRRSALQVLADPVGRQDRPDRERTQGLRPRQQGRGAAGWPERQDHQRQPRLANGCKKAGKARKGAKQKRSKHKAGR